MDPKNNLETDFKNYLGAEFESSISKATSGGSKKVYPKIRLPGVFRAFLGKKVIVRIINSKKFEVELKDD
ncbi:hypothetical protein [Methanococcus maripaludis]|uniref:Uncharacterized protein n=1 Tax=Methanococcus maripaludis TaxID=39152 RepID=A0A7J9PE09_METMI|nr:hypothetical protein [Methanococcus maripaludis]MBA2861024.1 hypothetical protein [Methanococcus maripaludis]